MMDTPHEPGGDDGAEQAESISTIPIESELSKSYLDYAMSVIVSRALPDLRDGLKPVHRRILYAMHESRNTHDQPYRKSARPVGEVMGKYHPHGDSAIYEALVRMAQDFTMSLPLLDGQGNFGSTDGDGAAAMRYTEIRMAQPAGMMLEDIGLATVDFQDNYDGKDQEPVVLPARFPNLLVNGGSGIAVGMASKIPPYNLGETIDATIELIMNPDVSSERLIELMPAPDFPTGGIILGLGGSISTFHKGEGRIVVRARTAIEERGDRRAIIVTEIPYGVIKADMITKIAQLADKRQSPGQPVLEGIRTIRDESDRAGTRVVIELQRDAIPELVLNQLWHHTPMQSSFVSNIIALNRGQPMQLGIREILSEFIAFREEVVTRRTTELLRRSRNRSHILCGLAVAASNLDEVVGIIRRAPTVADAREALLARIWPAGDIADYIRLINDPLSQLEADATYRLTMAQVQAILELRLQRLTAMGVKENTDELQQRADEIRDYLDILSSSVRVRDIIRDELLAIRHAYAIPRRSPIEEDEDEIIDEDLIKREDMAVIATAGGYLKRCSLTEFRTQARGGKGLTSQFGDDPVHLMTIASTHDNLLCFASNGNVYKIKTWRLPPRARNAMGLPVARFWNIDASESVVTLLPAPAESVENDQTSLVVATSDGRLRRSAIADYRQVNRAGKIAWPVGSGTRLVGACLGASGMDVIQLSRRGSVIRTDLGALRLIKSRSSAGVKGIRTSADNPLTGIVLVPSCPLSPDERENYLKARRAYMNSRDSGLRDSDPDAGEFPDDPVQSDAITAPHHPPAPDPPTQPDDESCDHSGRFLDEFGTIYAKERLILILDAKGRGKITSSHEFPVKKTRTGKGLRAYSVRGAPVETAAILVVEPEDQILVVTSSGQTLRCAVSSISYRSRTAGGVKVIDTDEDDEVVFATIIKDQDI
ncbi:MAG: DNA gyrase subunit A, partial [Rhodobacteraceae bacterium]|nr:DNA gyrase subunit A [Paracoccaceae bacterium]